MLSITARDVDEQELVLIVDAERCRWTLLDDGDEYRLSMARRDIVAAIQALLDLHLAALITATEQVRAAFAMLGAIAERATSIHQRASDDALVYDICTGMLDGDPPLRPHRHLVQLRIHGAAISAPSRKQG
jgi:hypothetical protein